MSDINHLNGIESSFIQTTRLRMHLLTAGKPGNTPILFLHGNSTSATIWEEFMLQLSDDFYCIAPDLRGFGLTDENATIDATNGSKDWVDDITTFVDELELDSFHLIGHSMGGFICWGLLAQLSEKIQTAALLAPGPPMGFGGLQGEKGIPNNADFSGSGAGLADEEFVRRLQNADRSADHPFYSPRNAMNRTFWKEGFKAEREEDILSAMLNMHMGERQYPGDYTSSEYWPGTAPGKFGPMNAMSPKYNQTVLPELLEIKTIPPLLWIQGTDDHIISNQSFSDPGFQGKLGLKEGWPGQDKFPPQLFVKQIQYSLQKYEKNGGRIQKKYIENCGHTAFIEKPEITRKAILSHFKSHSEAG